VSAGTSLADFDVGDRVYCLAWVGARFEVVDRTEAMLSLAALADANGAAATPQIDIFPETVWMVTRELWDQIWFWPDRAGERYEEVFDRFMSSHGVGEVVAGYHFAGGLDGFEIRLDAARAMAFRIRSLDNGTRQVRVHPVAAIGDDVELVTDASRDMPDERWLRSGPTLPLRIEMRMYRWCLCFGELVLNWQDLLPEHKES
jgi:hypothetical protein